MCTCPDTASLFHNRWNTRAALEKFIEADIAPFKKQFNLSGDMCIALAQIQEAGLYSDRKKGQFLPFHLSLKSLGSERRFFGEIGSFLGSLIFLFFGRPLWGELTAQKISSVGDPWKVDLAGFSCSKTYVWQNQAGRNVFLGSSRKVDPVGWASLLVGVSTHDWAQQIVD